MNCRHWVTYALPLLFLAGCATSPKKQFTAIVAMQQQADQAYARGDMQQAFKDYKTLTESVPRQAPYWFRLGNVCFRLGQPEKAIQAYDRVLRLDPGNSEAWYNLGIVRLHLAEAAFIQAASNGKPGDAMQQQSTHMADRLAELTGTPSSSPKPADQAHSGSDTPPKSRGGGT